MWRSTNYEEIFSKLLQETYRDDMSLREVADIGANALLEALKHRVGSRRNKGNSGWLVFIPDEE